MSKVSNVITMLELLQSGRKYSINELSNILEVSERMYFDDWNEHDHGVEIYTVLGDDGKTYIGSTSSSEYVCNCLVIDKESLIKEYETYIKLKEVDIAYLNARLKSKIDELEVIKSYKEEVLCNDFEQSLVLGKK